MELLTEYITKGGDPNMKDPNGLTLLYHATQTNDIESVKYLLESGAMIAYGDEVLHRATIHGFSDILICLLKSIDSEDLPYLLEYITEYGYTPLGWAIVFSHFDCCKILLDYGAVIDDECLHSLKKLAKEFNRMEILGLLDSYNKPPIKEPDDN